MSMARPGDLVVLTPTEVEDMSSRVLNYRAVPRPCFVQERLSLPEAAPANAAGLASTDSLQGASGHA